jgi:hypothetical protein
LSGIQADFSGALKKTAMLRSIPAAARMQLEKWATETVRDLKLSARETHMRGHGANKSTGQLWRNIGMEKSLTATEYHVSVGTGLQGFGKVKYAWIQDKGGTTHPTVTPRMRRWAWAMFYKMKDDKYKAIALTKKAKLDVRIRASGWFSNIIKRREPLLKGMMDAGAIKVVAERMEGKSAE